VTEELAGRMGASVVVDYITARSYGNGEQPAGPVEVDFRMREPIRGRHILLVDDIADTGQTLATIIEHMRREEPKSLRTFVLTNKPMGRIVHVPLDYVGFTVPGRFIVGFGMGRGEQFRDLPFLGYVTEER